MGGGAARGDVPIDGGAGAADPAGRRQPVRLTHRAPPSRAALGVAREGGRLAIVPGARVRVEQRFRQTAIVHYATGGTDLRLTAPLVDFAPVPSPSAERAAAPALPALPPLPPLPALEPEGRAPGATPPTVSALHRPQPGGAAAPEASAAPAGDAAAPPLPYPGYPGLAVALVQRRPALLDDPGVQRYGAAFRSGVEYARVASNEFELQPLLDRASSDLASAAAASPPGRLVLIQRTAFGSYDFVRHEFPFQGLGRRVRLGVEPCCGFGKALPGAMDLDLSLSLSTGALPRLVP